MEAVSVSEANLGGIFNGKEWIGERTDRKWENLLVDDTHTIGIFATDFGR